jgi:hypothetical protein
LSQPARKSKQELESELSSRFGSTFGAREKTYAETASTGVAEIDELTGGLPRGAITEVFGPPSSGRTTLFHSILASATGRGEICALIDATDSFDPASAANAGLDLERLLWIRCTGNLEHAIKAVDLLLQAGGFGIVVLDFGDVSLKDARRIPQSYWFRFKRAVEPTKSSLLVITEHPCARSCAAVALKLNRLDAEWSGPEGDESPTTSYLLAGVRVRAERLRPAQSSPRDACFEAKAPYSLPTLPEPQKSRSRKTE